MAASRKASEQALMEQVSYDSSGQPITGSFMD